MRVKNTHLESLAQPILHLGGLLGLRTTSEDENCSANGTQETGRDESAGGPCRPVYYRLGTVTSAHIECVPLESIETPHATAEDDL